MLPTAVCSRTCVFAASKRSYFTALKRKSKSEILQLVENTRKAIRQLWTRFSLDLTSTQKGLRNTNCNACFQSAVHFSWKFYTAACRKAALSVFPQEACSLNVCSGFSSHPPPSPFLPPSPPLPPKSQASLWDENLKPTMQNLFEVSLSKKPQIKDSSAKQNIFLQSHVDVKQVLHTSSPSLSPLRAVCILISVLMIHVSHRKSS